MELDNLGSAESFTLTASCVRGQVLSRSGTSNIETVTLADHVLAGHLPRKRQVHLLRKPGSSSKPEVEAPEIDDE